MNICIPFGNLTLVLTENQFQEAKELGNEMLNANTSKSEVGVNDRILDAKGMSDVTGVPQTWFLDQARQKKIPCIRAGKYVRFEESKVLKYLRVKNK